MVQYKKIYVPARIPKSVHDDIFRLIEACGLDENRTDFIVKALEERQERLKGELNVRLG